MKDTLRRLAAISLVVAGVALVAGCDWLTGLGGTPSGSDDPTVIGEIGWTGTAEQWRGNIGKVYQVTLPAGGPDRGYNTWGTDIYTDDSSIGTAAVHAGLITFDDGGTVKIRILAGRDSYTGSPANGVTTGSWDAYDGSFEFVTD